MTSPLDNHTLNACLARAIGMHWAYDPQTNDHGYFDSDGNFRYTRDQWSPLQNASQMELVEAWLRENKWEYISGWNSQFNRHWAELRKGVKAFWTNDPNKKRAFALAVREMEQAQKGVELE